MGKHGPKIIGRNIRNGMKPGGFSIGTHFTNKRAPEKKNVGYKEIAAAASVVLEGRQMPRAEEAACKTP